jgi:hypothetical protein
MSSNAARVAGFLLLIPASLCAAQPRHPAGTRFDNQYMSISVLPGWSVERSSNPELKLVRGKFILTINPMFEHPSGAVCGRFPEETAEMRSVLAVMKDVDQPAGGWECTASSRPGALYVNKAIALKNLYTGGQDTRQQCAFPDDGHSVWFGSYFCAVGSYCEYTITLAYDTSDVNQLPAKDSKILEQIFVDSKSMLRSLHLKQPVAITKIVPLSAHPGEKVTIYGSGFRIHDEVAQLHWVDFPNYEMPQLEIAGDGRSLTFQVPEYVNSTNCPGGDPAYPASLCAVPMPTGDHPIRLWLGMFTSRAVTLRVIQNGPKQP